MPRLDLAALASLTAIIVNGCLFDVRAPEAEVPGYVSLELRLTPARNALLKTAAGADTVFRLDTLVIGLSAAGSADVTQKYTLSARGDTGNVKVTSKVIALAGLRSWKARIFTLDASPGAGRVDTVHRDSVVFDVKPGDTAFVSKTVNPAYSILRARLVSNSPGDIANPVKYVRLRVDGSTVDSTPVGRALRGVDLPNNNTGFAVGDSGFLLRTTNGGENWSELSSGTAANLYCVGMASASQGGAAGAGGVVIRTTNGTDWSPVTSGTAADLFTTFWTSGSNGWIAGAGGIIRKSTNGSTFSAQTSGTTADLRGSYFTSGSNGVMVGDGGVILKTTNGGGAWSKIASGTTRNLNAVFFASSSIGLAVGDGGTILKTGDGGTSWSAQSSGVTADLSSVYMTNTSKGTVVGKGGTLLATDDGGASWTIVDAGTRADLHGVNWTRNDKDGVAVGDVSAICHTRNNADFSFIPYGSRAFDVLLAYKRLTPNASHSLLLEAIDSLDGPLRGYQAARTVQLSPGKDTTLAPDAGLAPCGFSGSPACVP